MIIQVEIVLIREESSPLEITRLVAIFLKKSIEDKPKRKYAPHVM